MRPEHEFFIHCSALQILSNWVCTEFWYKGDCGSGDNIENVVVVHRNGPSSSTLTIGSDNSIIMEGWQLKYTKKLIHIPPT